jgi:hypothetical protein
MVDFIDFSLQDSRVTFKSEHIPALVFFEFLEDFYLEGGGFTLVVKEEKNGDYKNIFKEAHDFLLLSFLAPPPPPQTFPPFL